MGRKAKVVENYALLVDHYLSSIPVLSQEDFPKLIRALENLNRSRSRSAHNLDPQLRERISDIKQVLEDPELLLPHSQGNALREVFKKIVLERIIAKVEELKGMTLQERKRYIQAQWKKRFFALHPQLKSQNYGEFKQQIEKFQQYGIFFRDLMNLGIVKFNMILSSDQIFSLLDSGVKFESLASLDGETLAEALLHANIISHLIKEGFDFAELFHLNRRRRNQLFLSYKSV